MPTSTIDPFEQVPGWVLRTLPANAVEDAELHARLDKLAAKLPGSLRELHELLDKVRTFSEYDAAANRAAALVWPHLDAIYSGGDSDLRTALLEFAHAHMATQPRARIYRRLAKDP